MAIALFVLVVVDVSVVFHRIEVGHDLVARSIVAASIGGSAQIQAIYELIVVCW